MRCDLVAHLRAALDISERRAFIATGFERSSQRYRSKRDPQTALRIRIRDLAAVGVRYGYRRLHVLLRREGWSVSEDGNQGLLQSFVPNHQASVWANYRFTTGGLRASISAAA